MWGQYYFERNSPYLCLSWRNDERKYIISYSSNVVLRRFGQVVLPYVLTFIILRTKAVHRCTLRRLRGPNRPKNLINNLQKANTFFKSNPMLSLVWDAWRFQDGHQPGVEICFNFGCHVQYRSSFMLKTLKTLKLTTVTNYLAGSFLITKN